MTDSTSNTDHAIIFFNFMLLYGGYSLQYGMQAAFPSQHLNAKFNPELFMLALALGCLCLRAAYNEEKQYHEEGQTHYENCIKYFTAGIGFVSFAMGCFGINFQLLSKWGFLGPLPANIAIMPPGFFIGGTSLYLISKSLHVWMYAGYCSKQTKALIIGSIILQLLGAVALFMGEYAFYGLSNNYLPASGPAVKDFYMGISIATGLAALGAFLTMLFGNQKKFDMPEEKVEEASNRENQSGYI